MGLYKISMLICREEGQSRNKFAITLCYHDGYARVYTYALLWGCANVTLTGDRWHVEIGKFRVNVIRDNLQWCERDLGRLMWHNTELEAAVSLFEEARKGNGMRICSLELCRKDIPTRAVTWLEGSRIIVLNWLAPHLGISVLPHFPNLGRCWRRGSTQGTLALA